jgi:hypothetical protein
MKTPSMKLFAKVTMFYKSMWFQIPVSPFFFFYNSDVNCAHYGVVHLNSTLVPGHKRKQCRFTVTPGVLLQTSTTLIY